ncbi:MAG: MFS transporter [Anaerolineae bacterium]|nr:MFS transporter [Anaerolineae bacterium]
MAVQQAAEKTLWRGGQWKVPFFTIWTGQAFSLIGSSIAMFALIWWITDETESATVLAIASMFSMLPGIVLGPFAGVFVDRWNRRAIIIVADSVIALASLALVYLFWADTVQIWHIYTVMFIRSLGGMFHWPAMQSSTTLMVPEQHLARVSGINQAMIGMLNIVGPALGAMLLSLVDIYAIMLLDVVTAAFAVAPLLFIAIPQPERKRSAPPAGDHTAASVQPSMWSDLREAFDYLIHWRGMMMFTGMALIVKLMLTPAFALLPILVTQHFNHGAPELALSEALFGVGVIIGGLLLGVWGGFKRNMHTILVGLILCGAALVGVGVLPEALFAGAVGLLFVVGVAVSLIDGPMMAMMQKTIAPEMQGRVFMLFGSLISLSSPVGLAVAGPFTDAVGVQVLYVLAGGLMLLTTLSIFITSSILNLEDYAGVPENGVIEDDDAENIPVPQPAQA